MAVAVAMLMSTAVSVPASVATAVAAIVAVSVSVFVAICCLSCGICAEGAGGNGENFFFVLLGIRA